MEKEWLSELSFSTNHTHSDIGSNLRMLDSIARVKNILDRAIELGYRGVVLTEHEAVTSHVPMMTLIESYKKEGKLPKDFKVGYGNEIYLVNSIEDCRNKLEKYNHFIVVAKDKHGHEIIRRLSSCAWEQSYKTGKMRRTPIQKDQLVQIMEEHKGKGHIQVSTACFTSGHRVLTSEGYKEIQKVNQGDRVLTFGGTWEKVNFSTKRNYSGKGYDLLFKKNTNYTRCTEDHKFLVWSDKTKEVSWKEAKDLETKDTCLEPVQDYVFSNNTTLDFTKELEKLRNRNSYTKGSSKRVNINSVVHINNDFMRTFGLYLADGHVRDSGVGFSFNEKEFEDYFKFVKEGMRVFGDIKYYICKNSSSHKVDLFYYSVELAHIFKLLTNSGKSLTKFIPNELKNISRELNMELIYGYLLGDGYFRTRKVRGYLSSEIASVTISKDLHEDIVEMYKTFGHFPSIRETKEKIDKNGVKHQKAYYISLSCKNLCSTMNKTNILSHEQMVQAFDLHSFPKQQTISIGDNLYIRKKLKTKTLLHLEETVYCLNVENNHNFVCNNTIVHNCLGNELSDMVFELLKTGDIVTKHKIHNYIKFCKDVFGEENVFLEIQPSHEQDQIEYNKFMMKLSKAYNLPVQITNDVHYIQLEHKSIHAAYLSSRDADRETDSFYNTCYMMTIEEMWDFTKEYLTQEEFTNVVNNTTKFVDQLEQYNLFQSTIVPARDISSEIWEVRHIFREWYDKCSFIKKFSESEFEQDRFFLSEIEKGFLEKKIDFNEEAITRIDHELEELWLISEKLGERMSSYYNLVQMLVDIMWTVSVVGVSRGSVAGFFICYLTDIHQLNPLEYKLTQYWRHVERNKVSLADIDCDASGDKKAQILDEVKKALGYENVLNIMTIKTEKTKSAILTVMRGIGVNNDEAQYIASLIEQERGNLFSLKDTWYGNEEKERKPNRQFINEIEKLSQEKGLDVREALFIIEGMVSGYSSHACG